MPSMDATVLGFDIDNAHASESIETESGDFEIMLLDDLDMDRNHQPGACYRFSDLSNGASLDGIYIKKIYPNGHGYPCPNPCPAGRPVRIGDIGTLTSTGFIAIANLTDCQLPSLQSELASLALSDPLHDPNYFLEGHSITGGVSVENIEWPLLQIIRSIEYHCHAPQGAILAVTSPAQLHTLPPDRNDRLRAWLCKHGMDLVQFLDPGRTDSLYIVTGKVTSSSWATATYSEPMTSPDDVLVLARSFYGLPPYYWRKPRTARHWSKSSSAINPGGERASDQCLFLRGFLLTPSSKCPSREAHYALKTSNSIPGTRYPDIGTTGNASGEGSSQLDRSFHPSNQSGGSCEPLAGGEPNNSEQDDVLVEEVPSSRSVDFYPSHRINRRLLELTDADLAITHDDDWRFRLEGLHRNSMLGTRELEGVAARPSGHAGLNAGDMAPGKRLYEGDQISSMGKEEQGQVRLLQSSHRVKSTGSANVAGSDMTNHDVKMTEHSKEPRQLTTIPAKVSTTGEKNFELSMSSESGAQPEVRPLLHDQHVSSAQTQAPRSMTPEHTTTSSSPHRLDSEYVPPAFLSQAVPEASSLPSFDTLQSLSALESLPNHRTTHIEILGKATPRTGQWLLKWEKYWLWLESTGKLKIFWGVGTVGAGKTVLASIVIDDLENRAREHGGLISVCYVYFRYSNDTTTTVRDVLEILVKQTVEKHPSCLPHADQVYARHMHERTRPTEGELLQVLRSFTQLVATTFYVLEALDEAPVKLQLHLVRRLASLNVKIFITSRPLEAVQAYFPNAGFFTIAAQGHDLELHITHKISHSPELRTMLADTTWHRHVVLSITQKANGMFLYASRQLDDLSRCKSIGKVVETLEVTPHAIEEDYIQTWKRILDRPQKEVLLAETVLLWALTACRPLRIDEVQRAVATDPETHQFDPRRLVPQTLLIDICLGLVCLEKESKIVRLIHSTVKATLERLILNIFPHGHSHLAEVCITHLIHCEFQQAKFNSVKDIISTLQGDPLLAYAHHAWAFHSRQSMNIPSFGNRLAEFVSGCRAFPVAIGEAQQLEVLGPLHVAAFFDLPVALAGPSAVRQPNIPTRNKGITPLGLACHQGSLRAAEEILGLPRLLVNVPDNDGWTPLHWAAWRGCEEVVAKLLVQPEIQANLVNKAGQSPLTLASQRGHTSTVKLLLADPHTQVNLVDASGQSALMLASLGGYKDIVELLLIRSELQVNLVNTFGQSALMLASWRGHRSIAELLLAHPHTQANLVDASGRSALMLASLGGYKDIVELLLIRSELQVNLMDTLGQSALMLASVRGHKAIIELLLNHPDLQVNLIDNSGQSALMLATLHGHPVVVELLLGHPDTKVNLKDALGQSALTLASRRGCTDIVKLLCASPNTTNTVKDQVLVGKDGPKYPW